MRATLPALLAAAVLAIAAITALAAPHEASTQAGPELTNQYLLHTVSRDVLPDVGIEFIDITASTASEASYRYRIRNVGDAPADLSRFTLQAWFSADAVLQKGVDQPAGVIGFTISLAAGATLEAESSAQNGDAPIDTHPYLILEVDSAGAVVESNPFNNVLAARRPPADLVADATITWDMANNRATVFWSFRGSLYNIPDRGFRIETPGFGVQTVPPGARDISVPFNPVTGERPCFARVAAILEGDRTWPAVETNNLCN
ncbi:MAG: hypothetical protein AB7T37_09400 [Dehalococcoidia bacterium]